MKEPFVKLAREFTMTKSLSDNGEFEGYASVFEIEDHHGDTVRKGAFANGLKKLIKERRAIKMLFNHDRYTPIGVFKEAEEDDKGLFVRGKLTLGVQKADETRLLMLDGAIDSMSIGGYVEKERVDNKTFKRDLIEIQLREISPVVFPALDAARVTAVKSLEAIDNVSDLEKYLRDVGGFSVKEAKRVIAVAKGVTDQRDVEWSADQMKQLSKNIEKFRQLNAR